MGETEESCDEEKGTLDELEMPIPQYQKLMRPVLAVLADGRAQEISVMREEIAAKLRLTKVERFAVTEVGRNLYDSRIGYAAKYLREAICCITVQRGMYKITERGSSLLKEKPAEISNDDLKRYREFREWLVRSRKKRLGRVEISETPPNLHSESAKAKEESPRNGDPNAPGQKRIVK